MYGGYGGSSYGSAGMGGYGGMYGSSNYGSSYGTGSPYGYRPQTQQQPQAVNGQQPQVPPQIPPRKMMMQQYFKMMGGLRSILQIGFAGVALANFGSRSWEVLKKVVGFLVKTSQRFAEWMLSFLPISSIQDLSIKTLRETSKQKLTGKLMIIVRVFAAIMICLCLKYRSDMKEEIVKKHEELVEKVAESEKKQEKYPEKQGFF